MSKLPHDDEQHLAEQRRMEKATRDRLNKQAQATLRSEQVNTKWSGRRSRSEQENER